MKRLFGVMVAALVLFAGAASVGAGDPVKPPQAGDTFPHVMMPAPETREHRDYLGLPRGDSFSLSQVKADIVIVEILSMYCPFCQAEAPDVNELYALIEADPKLKGKVKIIGIVAGNTVLERDIFRDKFQVPFPLIPDGDFVLHKAMGEARTPYFMGVRLEEGTARVFYSRLGAFEDPASFLALILEKSKSPEVSP